jgi:hypothetical protein
METTEKRIVEINGIKMEVDLRDCKVIEQYRVGDNIKVLIKEYSNDYRSYVGTIIGFDNFKETPTVVIAYLKTEYSSAEIKYLYFNKETKEAEITYLNNWDIPLSKSDVLKKFDSTIEIKKREIEETQNKKKLFEQLFGKFFEKRAHIEVI